MSFYFKIDFVLFGIVALKSFALLSFASTYEQSKILSLAFLHFSWLTIITKIVLLVRLIPIFSALPFRLF